MGRELNPATSRYALPVLLSARLYPVSIRQTWFFRHPSRLPLCYREGSRFGLRIGWVEARHGAPVMLPYSPHVAADRYAWGVGWCVVVLLSQPQAESAQGALVDRRGKSARQSGRSRLYFGRACCYRGRARCGRIAVARYGAGDSPPHFQRPRVRGVGVYARSPTRFQL